MSEESSYVDDDDGCGQLAYVLALELKVSAVQRAAGQCEHLVQNGANPICAEPATRHGMCEAHYLQHKCRTCDSVKLRHGDFCEPCLVEQRRLEAERVRVAEEAEQQRQVQLEGLLKRIAAAPPADAVACHNTMHDLARLGAGACPPKHEARAAYDRLAKISLLFDTNPGYALCAVESYWPAVAKPAVMDIHQQWMNELLHSHSAPTLNDVSWKCNKCGGHVSESNMHRTNIPLMDYVELFTKEPPPPHIYQAYLRNNYCGYVSWTFHNYNCLSLVNRG